MDYKNDIQTIISHSRDNGAELWATKEGNLLKGAPFTTLESAAYLKELGLSNDELILKKTAELILGTWQKDGRFRVNPNSAIYPCQSALALNVLCRLGYERDERILKSFAYFLGSQQDDGGWKCNKYSFGRGEETEHSTPYTTLVVLDAFRYYQPEEALDRAVEFLLQHWTIKKPISPCHYGIGSLFKQVQYPFRGYNLFYYCYVLSFYQIARKDQRYIEAFTALKEKTIKNKIIVERVVNKLAQLEFCRKGQVSELASKRYQEILDNLK